jgi:SsrA-binding protein
MANPNRPATTAEPKPRTRKTIADNRRARHEYHIIEDLEAGIVLTGTEVKSLRDGKVQLSDGYAHIEKGELWLDNIHIGLYKHGNIFNHEEKRKRKLLVHARELAKLTNKLKDQGVTLVPLSIYFLGNKVKVSIGLAKGKKIHDKRESIKARDIKREMSREE